MPGKLNAHLEEVDRAAGRMFDDLIIGIAKREGV